MSELQSDHLLCFGICCCVSGFIACAVELSDYVLGFGKGLLLICGYYFAVVFSDHLLCFWCVCVCLLCHCGLVSFVVVFSECSGGIFLLSFLMISCGLESVVFFVC